MRSVFPEIFPRPVRIGRFFFLAGMLLFILLAGGCATGHHRVFMKDTQQYIEENTIVSGATGQPVTYEEMLDDLAKARLVYVGENHADPDHHRVQLRIIRDLSEREPGIDVGIEMVDTPYQHILDEWSAGNLTPETFREKIHWYANWRYSYDLYEALFDFVSSRGIRLIALNLPFHIPAKIAVGGLDNLLKEDRRYLPEHVDLSEENHRAYIHSIFQRHPIRGRDNFEYFYMAQCAWEDTMAENIAANLGNRRMVVLIGNGHIVQKFGVPNRAYLRTRAAFKTLYLTSPKGGEASLTTGDYIWVVGEGQPR
jgi:uncharacterized iron-regulated protein